MFDVGFFELIIIFGIGLLVLGPERLPRVATKIGNWVGQARRMTRNLRYQLEDELSLKERQEAARKFVTDVENEIKSATGPGESPPADAPSEPEKTSDATDPAK